MATKSPLALAEIPGESSAMTEARQSYLDTQKKLLEALESRNQLFDPTLLAMAQGFLAPTKSGSFGESIANVAASVGPVAEAERKRDIEMAQIRAELAAGQYGAAQKGEALKQLSSAMQPPTGGAATGTAGSATDSANMFAGMTPERALQIAMFDPELGKQAFQYLEARGKRYAVQPSGTVDLYTQKFTPHPGQAPTERTIPGVGTIRVSLEDAIRIDKALEDNDAESLSKVVRKYTVAPQMPGAEAVPSGSAATTTAPATTTPARRSVPVTQEEREAQKREDEIRAAGQMQEAKERATSNVKTEEKILSDALIAPDLIRNSETLIQLATSPNTKRTFGILQQAGFLGALGQLGEDTLRVGPGINIGIPSIETAIRTATRSPAEIRAAEIAATAATSLELNFRKLFYQGTGSVSNAENETVRRLGGSIKDTPEGLVAKAEMIKARSEFDQKVANIFRDAQSRGVSVRDFRKDNKQYDKALQEYETELQRVRDSIINFRPSTPTSAPSAVPRTGQLVQPGSAGRKTIWELKNGKWTDTGRAQQ